MLKEIYDRANAEHNVDWYSIAKEIKTKTASACNQKMSDLIKIEGYQPYYKWTKEEEVHFAKLLKKYGGKQVQWAAIEKEIGLHYFVLNAKYKEMQDAQ